MLCTGFTLMEMMIVLVVMAGIAAIAIPNLVEIRNSNGEAQAAVRLSSEILPAMVQFHADARIDENGDGLGENHYAGHIGALAGRSIANVSGARMIGGASVRLVPAEYARLAATANTNAAVTLDGAATDRGALIGGFIYGTVIDTAAGGSGPENREDFVTVIACPQSPRDGRRAFGFTCNPHHYPAIWSRQDANLRLDQLLKNADPTAADADALGMFFSPAGYPRSGKYPTRPWGPNRAAGTIRYTN